MKFKAYGRMQSCPGFDLVTHVDPLDFESSIYGAIQGSLGPFAAEVGEIPIKMTIPFMKRCDTPVIASIGGIKLGLDKFNIQFDKVSLNLNGVIGGKDGIKANLKAKVDCETDMAVSGSASGHIGLAGIDLGNDEIEFPEQGPRGCGKGEKGEKG